MLLALGGQSLLTPLFALFKAFASGAQFIERNGACLIAIHESTNRLLDRFRLSHETAPLPLIRVKHRANFVVLCFDLGRELRGLLEPSLQVLPYGLLDILRAERPSGAPGRI